MTLQERPPAADPGRPDPEGRPCLLGATAARLSDLAVALGEPSYRGRQMFGWIHARRARTFSEMTSLPEELRQRLAGRYSLARPAVDRRRESADGSTKWVLHLADGAGVEAVHIPDGDRVTLCISSQVGCRFACSFCATGTMGLVRQLDAHEIVSQVMLLVEEHDVAPGAPFNVVFMGMGEPMDNLDAVLEAFQVLTDRDGFGLSWRRITVSTVGVIPGIRRLAAEPRRPRLAISLSATEDAARDRLVPVNRKWPLERLRQELAAYPVRRGEQITLEYVVLCGENDTADDAGRLAALARGLPVRVNLIPWNEHPELPHVRPSDARTEAFRDALRARGIDATIRFSRGRDVGAACGQLVTLTTTPAVGSST